MSFGASTPKPTTQPQVIEKIVEVPVVQMVEKIVEKPVIQYKDRIVEKVVEKIVEVPVIQVQEKIVDRPVIQIKEVIKIQEKIVEVKDTKEIETLGLINEGLQESLLKTKEEFKKFKQNTVIGASIAVIIMVVYLCL